MVCLREFRVPLPFSVEEYRIAQLYMIAKITAEESVGRSDESEEGVEILKNEPYEDPTKGGKGQYTHKIYHLAGKLPNWVASLIPKKAMLLEEKAWNAFPYCLTTLTSPYFTKFQLRIESRYSEGANILENALNCQDEILKIRTVENLDIAVDTVETSIKSQIREREEMESFVSQKTGRGPLLKGWQNSASPIMTAYKLVTVDVPYWAFGAKLEKYISRTFQRRLFLESNRKAFLWMDHWHGLTMADIRKMEEETFSKINHERQLRKAKLGKSHDRDDHVIVPLDDAENDGSIGSASVSIAAEH